MVRTRGRRLCTAKSSWTPDVFFCTTDFNYRPDKTDNGKVETGRIAYKIALKSRQKPTRYYKNLQICGQNDPENHTKTDTKLRQFGIAVWRGLGWSKTPELQENRACKAAL